jgi:hypothetical protein
MKKSYIALILILIMGVSVFAYWQYNRGPRDLSGSAPDHQLAAVDLFNAYAENEIVANELYLDRVIEVQGRVMEVSEGNPQTVVLETDDPIATIQCELAQGQEVSDILPGDIVNLKGQCAGYLMDIVLVKCVIR